MGVCVLKTAVLSSCNRSIRLQELVT